MYIYMYVSITNEALKSVREGNQLLNNPMKLAGLLYTLFPIWIASGGGPTPQENLADDAEPSGEARALNRLCIRCMHSLTLPSGVEQDTNTIHTYLLTIQWSDYHPCLNWSGTFPSAALQ